MMGGGGGGSRGTVGTASTSSEARLSRWRLSDTCSRYDWGGGELGGQGSRGTVHEAALRLRDLLQVMKEGLAPGREGGREGGEGDP